MSLVSGTTLGLVQPVQLPRNQHTAIQLVPELAAQDLFTLLLQHLSSAVNNHQQRALQLLTERRAPSLPAVMMHISQHRMAWHVIRSDCAKDRVETA